MVGSLVIATEEMKDIPFICQEDITSLPPKAVSWEIPGMAKDPENGRNAVFIARLRTLLDQPKAPSPRALSLAIGANASYISQLLNGKGGTPSAANLMRIAAQLKTTTDYLAGTASTPEQPVSEVSFVQIPPAWTEKNPNTIRVLGTGLCDDLAIPDDEGGEMSIERLLLDHDHTVELVNRPPALTNSPDAYAIYFQGSSMEPRYYQGEIGFVDPRRPPGPGDFVVVQLTDGTDDQVITVLVKQLLKVNGSHYELRQFNPPLDFRVPRRQVARIHRICRPNDLVPG